MTVDAADAASALGVCLLALATLVADLEGALAAALLGGFALSVSLWRLRGGRPWEALGWLAWVGAAVVLALGPADSPPLLATFFGTLVLGFCLLVAGRLDVIPNARSPAGDLE